MASILSVEEKQHIGQLFDRIAGTYDGLNHGLSMNIDRNSSSVIFN